MTKPLLELAGRPMLQHVHERATESEAAEIIIATDDQRIEQAATAFGARVCMTSARHESGTERLAEVAARYAWDDDVIVVNLQGDEPLMPPHLIDQVAADLASHADAVVATLAYPLESSANESDPHVVKVVLDEAGYVMYFSRAPIPCTVTRTRPAGACRAATRCCIISGYMPTVPGSCGTTAN